MADKKQRIERESLSEPGRRIGLFRHYKVDEDAFGRFAELIARFMGSPTFLIWMTVFIIVWILLNVNPGTEFDEYPFMLLTLMLSIEAAYSAPLILLAQNRQEHRDRLSLDEDRRVAAQSRADMDFLAREIAALRQSVGEVATRDYVRSEIRDQLHELLAELDRTEHPTSRADAPSRDAEQPPGWREGRPTRRD